MNTHATEQYSYKPLDCNSVNNVIDTNEDIGREEPRIYISRWRRLCKKITFILMITFIGTLIISWDLKLRVKLRYKMHRLFKYEWSDRLNCFKLPGNKIPELDEDEPKLGSSIFFHETSCSNDMSDINLNARQACSVESALRAHRDLDVYLLISSSVFRRLETTRNTLVQQLLTYTNFKLRHITFGKYLSNTPLKIIHTSGALNSSLWPVIHSSDVLRYTTLYKFGGIYLDLDVIVLKSLINLKNFAGAESDVTLGSGILGFSSDKTGREVARDCVKELASTYNFEKWAFNGPGVITRVLQRRCKTSAIPKMFKKYCRGFRVYPAKYFFALPFRKRQLFFQEGSTEQAQRIFKKSYTIHFWNKMTSDFVLNNSLDIPFLKYAQKYCPKIYKAVDGNF